jgi:hypothetical protein
MPDPCWYDVSPARLVLEVMRVSRTGRPFRLCRLGTLLYWLGDIGDMPPGVAGVPAKVVVWYPEAFPAIPPFVTLIDPKIGDDEVGHAWHRWADGGICMVRPSHWNLATTADEVIEKVADWYFNYTAKKAGLIDEMPDVGRAPI